jgi:hypothetical protein
MEITPYFALLYEEPIPFCLAPGNPRSSGPVFALEKTALEARFPVNSVQFPARAQVRLDSCAGLSCLAT